MNQRQRENEEKIFKAIQDLKDSVFGLRQPYISYCYNYSEEDGYRFVPARAEYFAAELTRCAMGTRTYGEELSEVMPLFFRTILRLLAAICGSGDWVFVSFRKLAEAALKDDPEDQSVLERIVDSHRAAIARMFFEEDFYPEYEAFRGYMGRVDGEAFYLCVKHAVEDFVDEQRLNVLDHDQLTGTVVARISRLAATIDRDLDRPEVPGENDQ